MVEDKCVFYTKNYKLVNIRFQELASGYKTWVNGTLFVRGWDLILFWWLLLASYGEYNVYNAPFVTNANPFKFISFTLLF